MRLFTFLALTSLAALTPARGADTYFSFHDEAQDIYQHILELRLDAARLKLDRLSRREPGNLITHHLANYIDFFTLHITEDENLYRQLLPRRDQRLAAVLAGDPKSPYYYYVQAEIRLHWALIRLRFEDYLPAFRDMNRAHKLLLKNQELYPDFLPNLKDLGVLHAVVGTIPDQFRWGVELLTSLEGSVDQGKAELQRMLADKTSPYHQEAQVLYVFLLLHLDNQPEVAWRTLRQAGLQARDNPLHCFVLANVAMRTGRNEEAIRYLEAQPRGSDHLDFPYLDFMLGLAKLRRLDTGARIHLQSFIKRYRGRHSIKEAHQKIAWAELLRGDKPAYHARMQLVLRDGTSTDGNDKNALKEAQKKQAPHPALLRARLLFDGGYYERAREQMETIKADKLPTAELRLEYHYRTGRILHGLHRYDEALAFYQRTIADGRSTQAFFACNAALQAGLIEEKQGRKTRARQYFEQCLAMQPDEYATGLHQQAKAGLVRIGKE